MSGLDKEKVQSIIEEASKGSKFYAAKMKSQERISRQERTRSHTFIA
jgi:hypothetical protein